ncbi:MAG: hypothetical protein GEU78_11190 [Actinobacteria bacterium]|nr:hypothetical protein [Actinomycetota bacterium]
MIAVIGDYDGGNPTHIVTTKALEALPGGTPFEWIATDEDSLRGRLGHVNGLLIAPASPYRSMDGALEAIRFARERGVPLVGT